VDGDLDGKAAQVAAGEGNAGEPGASDGGKNAKEIIIPKTSVTGLGDYTRNVGYKTGSITFDYETKTFNYDRGIKLLADVMDMEEAGILDCFVQAGAELQRTQVAPEADAPRPFLRLPPCRSLLRFGSRPSLLILFHWAGCLV
jgi:hypothetical protein